MPRKRLAIRPVRKKLSLPGDLVAAVEERFFSEAKAKPSYGAFSALVAHLLRNWIEADAPIPEINREEYDYDADSEQSHQILPLPDNI